MDTWLLLILKELIFQNLMFVSKLSSLQGRRQATRDAACHKCDAAIIRILRLEIRIQFRRHLRVDFGHRAICF